MMDSKKGPATLESLPEDVIPYIVGYIKSWAEVKAIGINRQKEKESARRSRDFALSAVTATSKESYQKWLPHLLEEVALLDSTLPNFFFLLSRMPHSGSLVKTLRIGREWMEKENSELLEQLWAYFSETLGRDLDQEEFLSELLNQYLVRCTNLQNLILVGSNVLSFPFVDKNGFPFRCLTHSLKGLFVGIAYAGEGYLMTAQNSLWALVFCPLLAQAVLSFTVDLTSFRYLQEFASTFQRLSNVKQLSISPDFIWNADNANERSWKGYRKGKESLIGENLETQTIHNLLRVTKNLSSLEIVNPTTERTRLGSRVYPDCLGGISASFHSIKHLRFVLIHLQPLSSVRLRFSILRNLKILSVDFAQLTRLKVENERSESLEILHLPYYILSTEAISASELREDGIISAIIDRGIFPNLQRVAVPSLLARPDGEVSSDLARIQVWKDRRQELMENESIKKGKIKLMTLDLGETVGDVSKGENCLSAYDSISPFPA